MLWSHLLWKHSVYPNETALELLIITSSIFLFNYVGTHLLIVQSCLVLPGFLKTLVCKMVSRMTLKISIWHLMYRVPEAFPALPVPAQPWGSPNPTRGPGPHVSPLGLPAPAPVTPQQGRSPAPDSPVLPSCGLCQVMPACRPMGLPSLGLFPSWGGRCLMPVPAPGSPGCPVPRWGGGMLPACQALPWRTPGEPSWPLASQSHWSSWDLDVILFFSLFKDWHSFDSSQLPNASS